MTKAPSLSSGRVGALDVPLLAICRCGLGSLLSPADERGREDSEAGDEDDQQRDGGNDEAHVCDQHAPIVRP